MRPKLSKNAPVLSPLSSSPGLSRSTDFNRHRLSPCPGPGAGLGVKNTAVSGQQSYKGNSGQSAMVRESDVKWGEAQQDKDGDRNPEAAAMRHGRGGGRGLKLKIGAQQRPLLEKNIPERGSSSRCEGLEAAQGLQARQHRACRFEEPPGSQHGSDTG